MQGDEDARHCLMLLNRPGERRRPFLWGFGCAYLGLRDASFFADILVNPLPDGNDWIYNLDILDVCCTADFLKRNNIKDMFYQRLSGYAVKGIRYGSEAWSRAEELCKSASLNGILVPHHLNPGHMRIPIARERAIDDWCLTVNGGKSVPLDRRQLDVVRQLFDMCKGNDVENVKNRFDEEWQISSAC